LPRQRREMEAVTAAERADAEQRMQQLVQGLRTELEAKAAADLREAAADAGRQKRELEERVESLHARVRVSCPYVIPYSCRG
jgi:hypothetical protein